MTEKNPYVISLVNHMIINHYMERDYYIKYHYFQRTLI